MSPPLPGGATKQPPSHFCFEESGLIVLAVSNEPIYSSYPNLEGYVQDNGTLGLEGMLHLYSLWLAQSRQFFRSADSTKMQNLYNYWNGVLTSAAILKVELLHQEGEQNVGGQQLIAFLGNPTLTPPTTGIFQANKAANQSLMWPPVPVDPSTQQPVVVISTHDPNHSMWALYPYGNSSNLGPSCKLWGYGPVGVYGNFYGLSGWMLAGKPGWESAVSLSPMGTQWWNWLIQQTNTNGDELPASAGWFDWTHKCSNPGPILWGVWTQTQVSPPQQNWYVVDPINSKFQTSTGSGAGYFQFILRHPPAGEQYFWYQ